MGKPCVVGCAHLSFDAVHRTAKLAGTTNNEGDRLSVDGGTGALNLGHGNVEPRRALAKRGACGAVVGEFRRNAIGLWVSQARVGALLRIAQMHLTSHLELTPAA